jgi:hypothetical protein
MARVDSEVSIVDSLVGVVERASQETLGALAGDVYAVVYDAAGRRVSLLREIEQAPPSAHADAYERAEYDRGRQREALLAALTATGNVLLPGLRGRLVRWWGGLVAAGRGLTAERVAELASDLSRDIIWYFIGPAGEEPEWLLFRPTGRPLPVRVEDLPREAQIAIGVISAGDEDGEADAAGK